MDESSRGSTPSQLSSITPAKRGRFSIGGGGGAGDKAGDDSSTSAAASNAKEPMRKVVLPEALRKILVDDNNCVNRNNYLPKMPAKVTIDKIVSQYIESLGPDTATTTTKDFKLKYLDETETDNAMINPSVESFEQSALGLLDYFNITIGSLLLYKFERPLYSDIYAAEEEKLKKTEESGGAGDGASEMTTATTDAEKLHGKQRVHLSSQFGLVHLLRLFVRLGEMLTYTQWNGRSIDLILRLAQDFVNFLNQNHAEYFNIDDYYEVASPEYLKRVWSPANQ